MTPSRGGDKLEEEKEVAGSKVKGQQDEFEERNGGVDVPR